MVRSPLSLLCSSSRAPLHLTQGLLISDTYVGNFTFTGRENKRSGCPLGGGLIETPGCQGDYCGLHKDPPPGAPICNPPNRTMEECIGITNATAEYIHLSPWTMDHVGWFPPTVPWSSDQTSGSKMITLRHLVSWGSWADVSCGHLLSFRALVTYLKYQCFRA